MTNRTLQVPNPESQTANCEFIRNSLFCVRNLPLCKNAKGFTLLEALVGLGILGAVGAFVMVSFINARIEREIAVTSQDILSALRLAQAKTLAGEDDAVWGVHFDQAQYVLFRGPDYAASAKKIASAIPGALEITDISFNGGGSDVVFSKITGTTAHSGVLEIHAKGSSAVFSSITTAPSGKVYFTGSLPALAGTRLTDARHRAFDLGWSIKNSATLTFTFFDPPNPNTVQAIGMASYFNAGKTAFDWSGAVNIGGQDQTLRVHTVFLTDANTILHVDRDCRFNTKKLNIAIDGSDIVTYEADCETLTVGPFGGAVSEP